MLYTGTLLRAEIYDDHKYPYTNVKAVYEAHKDKYPGKLIVTNGHWYNTKLVTPCGNYKVNGHGAFKGKLDGLGFWMGHRADYHDEVHYPRDGN